MARIEDLVGLIPDETLRAELATEVAELKRRRQFGLVFERHVPESTLLSNAPIRAGSVVVRRQDQTNTLLRVVAIDGDSALVVPDEEPGPKADPYEPTAVLLSDLLVLKRFGEPTFPTLTHLETVRNADHDRHQVVIQGENYHALELLSFAMEGQVDVAYLDPPYNTGASDWTYNNDYVDASDSYRHSKWLSFMEKRLRLVRRCLKPDGILVITIDDNEVHHLGMLLEQLFPEARTQMATIAINPSGSSSDGLSRVHEHAFFSFFGNAQPCPTFEDFFGPENKSRASWWDYLMRRASAWVRAARPNQCYPIYVNAEGRIVGAGEPFTDPDESARPLRDKDCDLVWPVRKDGSLGIWGVNAARLRAMYPKGYVAASPQRNGGWSVKYLLDGAVQAIERGELQVEGYDDDGFVILPPKEAQVIAKTIWHRGRHTAGGSGGTGMVAALTGVRNAFAFPKSVYAVRDALNVAVGDRPDAVILDTFGGSGTTAHATMILNQEDGGRRRCILVTNNEINGEKSRQLEKAGFFRGDPDFEKNGVFQSATKPRLVAALTGRRPDATPVEGSYLDERPYADGFEENVSFFRLDYLDRSRVELGLELERLLPTLWLSAGARGGLDGIDASADFALSPDGAFAVLFRAAGLTGLLAALEARPDVTAVFVVTDSEEAFAEAAERLPTGVTARMLWRDYLRSFSTGMEAGR